MATPLQMVSNEANSSVDTPERFYLDDGTLSGTIIDAFTASNADSTSGINASYKAYIVDASGDAVNPQISFKIVVWGEKDLGAGVVNQLIPPGGSLHMEASDTNRIYFTVSGRKV